MSPQPRYEPSAVARQAAKPMYDMFQGLVQAGFTEAQALQIIGVALAAAVAKPKE